MRETVQRILTREPRGMTVEEISQNWPEEEQALSVSRLERYMLEGVGTIWQRSGAGTKGSPFRYFLMTPS